MSSRIRINRLPLQNAARAIRAVSSGTGSIGDGRIDIASLLQGVPRLNTPISPNDQQYQDLLGVEGVCAEHRLAQAVLDHVAKDQPGKRLMDPDPDAQGHR